MTWSQDQNWLIEVRKGNVPGHTCVHKFGRNDAVPNGSFAHVSLLPFAVANFRSTAATMRIKAGGDVADTAAGAGATEVTIQGIDSTLAEVTSVIATAGVGASTATTESYWRVHRAWVSGAGTYMAANTAAVTIEDSAGGADMIVIAIGEGQSQFAGFTIPTGKSGYLLSAHVTVDGNKAADVRCFTRKSMTDVTSPMPAKRLKLYWDGILGQFAFIPTAPEIKLDPLEDIWFEAQGAGAQTEVSLDFELLIVDD